MTWSSTRHRCSRATLRAGGRPTHRAASPRDWPSPTRCRSTKSATRSECATPTDGPNVRMGAAPAFHRVPRQATPVTMSPDERTAFVWMLPRDQRMSALRIAPPSNLDALTLSKLVSASLRFAYAAFSLTPVDQSFWDRTFALAAAPPIGARIGSLPLFGSTRDRSATAPLVAHPPAEELENN